MKVPFTKMQAYGNDYIYINTIAHPVEDPGLLSKKISDRHFGVGSDGLVLICASEICDFRMRIFNPDGTEAEMCGNALRSTAKYVYTYGLTEKKEFTIETLGGIKRLELTVTDKEVTDIRAHILPVYRCLQTVIGSWSSLCRRETGLLLHRPFPGAIPIRLFLWRMWTLSIWKHTALCLNMHRASQDGPM